MNDTLPSPNTPLYNHTLPNIEQWLTDHSCERDTEELHVWHVTYPTWVADIFLDIEELTVVYRSLNGSNEEIRRTFKYSLSRQDIESAVFSGP